MDAPARSWIRTFLGRHSWTAREKRMVVYLLLLAALVAWRCCPRPWTPTFTLETPHYAILSTATPDQTREIGAVTEVLHEAYLGVVGNLAGLNTHHGRLKMKLFKDRDQLRRTYRNLGWAEAFYRAPYCHAYYSDVEINPYHWMLHEATHQLNAEMSHLKLKQWLDEGLSEYLSTSQISPQRMRPGLVDPNTYPVWWMELLATTGNLEHDKANGSVIPLRSIISGHGGPSMNRQFNLYYLHWWSLTHFLFHYADGKHRGAMPRLLEEGGSLEGFERLIGPVDVIEKEWHAHVSSLKRNLNAPRPLKERPAPPLATNAASSPPPALNLSPNPLSR